MVYDIKGKEIKVGMAITNKFGWYYKVIYREEELSGVRDYEHNGEKKKMYIKDMKTNVSYMKYMVVGYAKSPKFKELISPGGLGKSLLRSHREENPISLAHKKEIKEFKPRVFKNKEIDPNAKYYNRSIRNKKKIFKIALKYKRNLSKNITPSEKAFRKLLRSLNVKHEIQYIVTYDYTFFIIDFMIESKGQKFAIEIDGENHEDMIEQDQERDKILKEKGYTVVRFTNYEVTQEQELVFNKLVDLNIVTHI